MIIYNSDQRSRDYDNVKDIFRPSHADFTYFHKYGIRDYRGGGRSSARRDCQSCCWWCNCKLILKRIGVEIESGVCEIAGIKAKEFDFNHAKSSKLFALDRDVEKAQEDAILDAKGRHDSVGGSCINRGKEVFQKVWENPYTIN